MFKSEEIKQLAAALSKAQGAMEHASKDSKNDYFNSKYANLAACIAAAKPHLLANGLSVVQTYEYENEPYSFKATLPKTRESAGGVLEYQSGGVLFLRTTLIHESGEFMTGLYPIIAKDMTNPQSLKSASSYARRTAFMAIVGLAEDDDDGNAAAELPKTLPKSKPTLSDVEWAKKSPAWKSRIVDDGKTVAELFKVLEGFALTKDQIEEIQSWGK